MPLAFKTGVRLKFTPAIQTMLRAAEAAYVEILGPGAEVVVTSGNDSAHGSASLHYADRAVDLRTGTHFIPPLMTREQAEAIVAALRRRLGRDYDVVLEADHIHVEYDPKPKAA